MRLDVESLRAFHLIAEQGGVTKAAENLCLSQSAVSHKIKRLEQRVGRLLFSRRDGQLHLTADGEGLYSYAKRILALHDEAVASLKFSDVIGEIRIGATENIALSGLTEFLNQFGHAHPSAQLRIKVEQSLVLQEWLRQERIDVALLQIEESDVEEGDLLLWQDDLVWVSAPDHEWSSVTSLPLITFGPNCFYHPLIAQALGSKKRDFHNLLECPTHSGVLSAVASGLGVAVINRRAMPKACVELSAEMLGSLPKLAYVARFSKQASNQAIEALRESLPDLIKD